MPRSGVSKPAITHKQEIRGFDCMRLDHQCNQMTITVRNLIISILLTAMITSCAPRPSTPTIHAIVDSFFSGYAFLDVNGNGELDSEDTPVENAAFIVTLQFGGEVGAFTNKTGYAFIVAPGGVDYPVKMRMEPPKDSTLKLIGPSEIIHDLADESPKFLFSK